MVDRVKGSRSRGSEMAGKLGVLMVLRKDECRRGEKSDSGETENVRLRTK